MSHEEAATLNAEELMERSREMAGIDLLDEDAVTPLRVLVDSINSESELHERGTEGLRNKLLRILTNRLRMKRDFAAHPEIEEQVIDRPIIIVGPPRTGSTKTQKLFAASGDFNWLAMWQTSYPALITGSRDESTRARIEGGKEYEDWLEVASPGMKYCHHFLAMEPEEDSWILEHSLVSPVFLGFSRVDSYVRWMIQQGITIQFEFLRDTLKYLQWQGVADPSKRWILKCPMYCGLEPAILETFPDAHFLMTHRSPVSSLPSGASMLELFHHCFSDRAPDIAGYYRGAGSGLKRHMKNRAADPEMKIHDIFYLDLVTDAEATIRGVYEFAGESLGEDSLQRMLDWNLSHPKDAKGKHVYSLEQYGFSKEQIEQDFAAYLDFMESRVGRR
jgi:hypothetical protein